MSLSSEAQFNLLLAGLPRDTLSRLIAATELVDLKRGQVLCESGVACPYIYFPTSAIISLLYVMEDGATVGVAWIGNEGVVGISQFLGGGSMPTHAVVHSPGKCMRLNAVSMNEEFKRLGSVMTGLLRYTQALMAQMSQAVVCNRHHTIIQQFCRYLLYNLDQVDGPKLAMTHDLVGTVLGVRRESVTQVARKLQHDGLITYTRGHITVLDRDGIEDRACKCYSVVRSAFGRIFPPSPKDHVRLQSSGFTPFA